MLSMETMSLVCDTFGLGFEVRGGYQTDDGQNPT